MRFRVIPFQLFWKSVLLLAVKGFHAVLLEEIKFSIFNYYQDTTIFLQSNGWATLDLTHTCSFQNLIHKLTVNIQKPCYYTKNHQATMFSHSSIYIIFYCLACVGPTNVLLIGLLTFFSNYSRNQTKLIIITFICAFSIVKYLIYFNNWHQKDNEI